MTELAIQVRLKADGSGLVGQLKLSQEELGRLGKASADAGQQARALATGTGEAEQAVGALSGASQKAGAAARDLAGAQRAAGAAAGSSAKGQREATKTPTTTNRRLAATPLPSAAWVSSSVIPPS